MFESLRNTNPGNGGPGREWGRQRASWLQQRVRDRAGAERISELKWKWRCACESADLAGFVYTASGVTRPIPYITDIELGPPIVFTVHVRPAQSAADFVTASRSIAAAMNVAAVDVVQTRTPWLLRIVLLNQPLAAAASGP